MKIQPWKPVYGCYGKVHYCLTGQNETLCGIKVPGGFSNNGWFVHDSDEPVDCKNCLKKAAQ